ncbi:MAG: DMT family transporter [Candidatus Latescibacterota bacterium]|nr:DMT family transporter [Candidatus Latescibacterota bacterium]
MADNSNSTHHTAPTCTSSATVPLLAASTATVLGGSMAVGTRYVMAEIEPATFAIWRTGLSFLTLLPALMTLDRPRFHLRDAVMMGMFGGGFFAFFNIAFAAALQYTTAAMGALILALAPTFTLFVAAARGQESFTLSKLSAAALSFLGVGIVVADGSQNAAEGSLFGNFLLLGVTLSVAFFNVFSKPFFQRYAPLHVSVYYMGLGCLILTLANFMLNWAPTVPVLSDTGWWYLVYLGTVGGALPALLFHWALSRMEASRVTVTLGLAPVSAAILGAVLLGETPPWSYGVGLLAVVAGVSFSSKARHATR